MIKRIVMENFLPFRKRVELNLANQGFVLVRGRNEISQAADANGVGKTSIAHAISYALFGQDLNGRKADAVACRFTEGQCTVLIDLEDNLGEWGIVRQRRPAKLMTYGIPGVLENDDADEIQRKIEARLGCGLRTFKNAVVFGQGTFDRFSHADQAEQMRMLDEIQGIDFREALARAKDWRSDLIEKLTEQQSIADTARLKGDGLFQIVAALQAARDEFETTKTMQIRNLSNTRTKIVAERDTALAEIERANQDLVLLDKLREENNSLNSASLAENAAIDAKEEAEDDVSRAEETVRELRDALDALEAAGACPTCRRGVKTKADQVKVRKLFAPTLAEAGGEVLVATSRMEAARKAAQEATEAASRAQAARDALVPIGEDPRRLVARLEVTTGSRATEKLEATIEALNRDIERCAQQIETLVRSQWTGQANLDETEGRVAAIQIASRTALARAGQVQTAIAMADYAVEAFGDRGIRSRLVDGVADYVNDRVREHLEFLAAGEATMKMSATTDLKKGGSKERISFRPEWIWGGNGKDDGSGGQERRMDLAVFAGVQDLAESRSARPFPLKIWDEPTDGLDSRGMELFTQWVAHQARTRGTGILISHNKEVTETVTPDHTWTVVLTDGGAHVEVDG